MGRPLAISEFDKIRTLLNLSETSNLNFRTFAGVAAVTERLLGALPPITVDPPHTLEQADFRSLDRAVSGLDDNSPLLSLLTAIKGS